MFAAHSIADLHLCFLVQHPVSLLAELPPHIHPRFIAQPCSVLLDIILLLPMSLVCLLEVELQDAYISKLVGLDGSIASWSEGEGDSTEQVDRPDASPSL
jgi:hypothetical protein